MDISSSQEPQDLMTFKKLPTDVPLDNIEIPERPENRRLTDKKWLIVLVVFILVFMPFFIYTMSYADVKRVIVGYDYCGNVCGQENYHWDGIECSGKNNTDYPHTILGRCPTVNNTAHATSDSSHQDTMDMGVYLDSVKWQIVISCLLSVLLATGMLFLFRYSTAFVVWGILIGCFLCVVVQTLVYWYLYFLDRVNAYSTSTLTVSSIYLAIMFIWGRKKILLVILLLKETTKAVFDVPRLMIIPVICAISILILTFLFILTTFYMYSAGTLEHLGGTAYGYVSNSAMIFTIFYNVVVYLWLFHFFAGIQYMIVAGVASKWYFSRDKIFVESPIMTATSNAFRFHLGSVALGALIIPVGQLIKPNILRLYKSNRAGHKSLLEMFVKFLTKNAYILTAMHGQSYTRSGKRAAQLILENIGDLFAINLIGDFVLGLAKWLIVIVTVLLSMMIFAIAPSSNPDAYDLPYFIVAVVAFLVAHAAFGVFVTINDTLFICYCEDRIVNDGMARPCFMSRGLMEFVNNSKIIL